MNQPGRGEDAEVEELLRLAGRGDREAFKIIVSLYQQQVFLLAYSILRNRDDALDIVQETFLRLYQKLGEYQRGKNFRGWLLQIAKNLSIDFYRRHRSREWQAEIDGSLEGLAGSRSSSESAATSSADLSRAISRGLERLSDRQRMVFVMKHYNGFDYPEIAEVLAVRPGTVKSLHFKAVRNLRRFLGPRLGIET